ncbi:MAG: hypothetical protein F6K22_13195 [Okeania sp. SIO2F4]|uniref:hypothetical protein n=1 Tax=Okeania sp. SIO2F4 TaxID=2607790 RepID=UPI00142AEBC4|nr:hypothetical protein [Okeania sp. SIO2F4]NES03714.1 hypothetical protein [Okeania sp. SIO2F4]
MLKYFYWPKNLDSSLTLKQVTFYCIDSGLNYLLRWELSHQRQWYETKPEAAEKELRSMVYQSILETKFNN